MIKCLNHKYFWKLVESISFIFIEVCHHMGFLLLLNIDLRLQYYKGFDWIISILLIIILYSAKPNDDKLFVLSMILFISWAVEVYLICAL